MKPKHLLVAALLATVAGPGALDAQDAVPWGGWMGDDAAVHGVWGGWVGADDARAPWIGTEAGWDSWVGDVALPAIAIAEAGGEVGPWTGWIPEEATTETAASVATTPIDASRETDAAAPARFDGEIDGFMGFSWHADSADVAAVLGIPIAVSHRKSGFRVFTYTPMFLDRDGFLNLWMHPELGLLRASYEAITSRCTEYMRSIVAELRSRHPRVPSETRGNVRLERLDKSLCSAVLDDGAQLSVVWTDRHGNRLRVGAGPRDPALRMIGTSEAFRRRLSDNP